MQQPIQCSRPIQCKDPWMRILQEQSSPVCFILLAVYRISHTMQYDTQALACLLSLLGVLKELEGTRDSAAACCSCAELSAPMPVQNTMHDVR